MRSNRGQDFDKWNVIDPAAKSVCEFREYTGIYRCSLRRRSKVQRHTVNRERSLFPCPVGIACEGGLHLVDRKRCPNCGSSSINVEKEICNECGESVFLQKNPGIRHYMGVIRGSKHIIAPCDFGPSTSRDEAWKIAKQADARARHELDKKRSV